MSNRFKLFYSTDWHCTGRAPETRLDSYPETIERKVRTFFEMGADMGCDAYGIGGDIMDSANASPQYATRVGEVLEEAHDKYRKPIYFILGNHDIRAYNPNSIGATSFGVFLRFARSYMRLLTRQPLEICPHGWPILLTGVSSYSQLDKHVLDPNTGDIIRPRHEDWTITANDGRPQIHIVHGYASPKPILDTIPHTPVDEFRHTKAVITLGAHEHTGTPVITLDNGLFYNPGALGRVFASHAEMNRMPKYAMVTVYRDGAPEIQPYDCPVAEPGHKVMDRSKLDEKKARESFLLQAREDVQDLIRDLNIGAIDLYLIVDRYKDKVAPDVYHEARRRLGM